MKRFLALVLSLALMAVLSLGCRQPARKPVPPAPTPAPRTVTPAPGVLTPTPGTPTPGSAARMPTTSADVHSLAAKLAAEAKKVPGVRGASVALSKTTAYVGIDLDPKIEAGQTNTVKRDVAARLKKADKRLTNVYVTADVGLVTRIKNVAEGISKGKPLSTFDRELMEIGRRLNPKTP